MVRYFYAWIPVAGIATLFILSLPWLGLVALLVLLALLVPLAAVVVLVPYRLGEALAQRWRRRHSARQPVITAVHGYGFPSAHAPSRRIGFQTLELGHTAQPISAASNDAALPQSAISSRDVS